MSEGAHKKEEEREAAFEEIVREHEEVQGAVESVLKEVRRRLDELSDDMRLRGEFPVASQIERKRKNHEQGAVPNGLR
jgi:hypothetical protein